MNGRVFAIIRRACSTAFLFRCLRSRSAVLVALLVAGKARKYEADDLSSQETVRGLEGFVLGASEEGEEGEAGT